MTDPGVLSIISKSQHHEYGILGCVILKNYFIVLGFALFRLQTQYVSNSRWWKHIGSLVVDKARVYF